jgi:hypothetical protein
VPRAALSDKVLRARIQAICPRFATDNDTQPDYQGLGRAQQSGRTPKKACRPYRLTRRPQCRDSNLPLRITNVHETSVESMCRARL